MSVDINTININETKIVTRCLSDVLRLLGRTMLYGTQFHVNVWKKEKVKKHNSFHFVQHAWEGKVITMTVIFYKKIEIVPNSQRNLHNETFKGCQKIELGKNEIKSWQKMHNYTSMLHEEKRLKSAKAQILPELRANWGGYSEWPVLTDPMVSHWIPA